MIDGAFFVVPTRAQFLYVIREGALDAHSRYMVGTLWFSGGCSCVRVWLVCIVAVAVCSCERVATVALVGLGGFWWFVWCTYSTGKDDLRG